MRKIRWGVLSTANIGMKQVIPAMQASQYCEIVAISSRDQERADAAAEQLGIPRAYGDYEALLTDPDVEAIYNPLPNHLHVPWTIAALEAGKHVLCEKPIALNSAEAQTLLDASKQYPQLKVMEAFMYRFHPQWDKVRELVENGSLGELKTIHTFFSYYNDDPADVRNQVGIGGGGLLDIGCYAINVPRYIYGIEPQRVLGMIETDPAFYVDRMTSAMMEFKEGTATFTVGTQLSYFQRVDLIGTDGRLVVEIPFNPPPDKPAHLWLHRDGKARELIVPIANQYTLQGDAFSRSILDDTPVPTPLEDAVANMKVIDALFQSAQTGKWIELTSSI